MIYIGHGLRNGYSNYLKNVLATYVKNRLEHGKHPNHLDLGCVSKVIEDANTYMVDTSTYVIECLSWNHWAKNLHEHNEGVVETRSSLLIHSNVHNYMM